MNAHQIVEAVLFASDAPLTADEIARADERLDEDQVEEAIAFLQAEYADAERAFQIAELAEGYQILTRPEFAPYLERFDNVPRPSRLSGPALETLAIIAYRQPLGRVEIEYIRGVGSSGVIRTLQERGLIDVVGRAEGLGRPLLYGTTKHFLEHFGFRSLEDLPRPEELPVILRERVPLGPPEAEAEETAGDEAGTQEELGLEGVGAEEGAEAEGDVDGTAAGEDPPEEGVEAEGDVDGTAAGEDPPEEGAEAEGDVDGTADGEDPPEEGAEAEGDGWVPARDGDEGPDPTPTGDETADVRQEDPDSPRPSGT